MEELEFLVPASGCQGATFVVLVELRRDGEKTTAHRCLLDPEETVQVAARMRGTARVSAA